MAKTSNLGVTSHADSSFSTILCDHNITTQCSISDEHHNYMCNSLECITTKLCASTLKMCSSLPSANPLVIITTRESKKINKQIIATRSSVAFKYFVGKDRMTLIQKATDICNREWRFCIFFSSQENRCIYLNPERDLQLDITNVKRGMPISQEPITCDFQMPK